MVQMIVRVADVTSSTSKAWLVLQPHHLEVATPMVTPRLRRFEIDGERTVDVDPSPVDNCLKVTLSWVAATDFEKSWWVRIPVAAEITLAELIDNHQVNPDNYEPTPADLPSPAEVIAEAEAAKEAAEAAALTATQAKDELVGQKGQPDGIAQLDEDGDVVTAAGEKVLTPTQANLAYLTEWSPLDFGAVGDGETNDSAAIQAAIDHIAAQGGGVLTIPRGFRFAIPDGIDLNTSGVSIIHRGGWLVGGSIRIGKDTGTDDAVSFAGTVVDVLFDGEDARGDLDAIVLKRVREVTIRGRYKNVNAVMSATADGGASGFHTIGQLLVDKVRASGHNYVVFVDTDSWDVCSDWTIDTLYSNRAAITALHFGGGIDGLSIRGGVYFAASYNSGLPYLGEKLHHLYVEKGNWISAVGAKFWESGRSAWRLDDVQEVTITGNEFAWSGELQLADAIEIRGGNVGGYIGGNEINQWTRAGIGVYGGDISRLTIGENDYQENLSHASNLTGTTLTASTTFRVLIDSAVSGEASMRFASPALPVFDSIKSRTNQTSLDKKTAFGGVSGFNRRSVTITAATSIGLLSDIAGAAKFSGLLVIQARSGSGGSAKTATYILAVSSEGPACTSIAANGLTTGAAADEPSFTWSIVNGNELRATPVGSTTGSGWWFDITTVGAVKVR